MTERSLRFFLGLFYILYQKMLKVHKKQKQLDFLFKPYYTYFNKL